MSVSASCQEAAINYACYCFTSHCESVSLQAHNLLDVNQFVQLLLLLANIVLLAPSFKCNYRLDWTNFDFFCI